MIYMTGSSSIYNHLLDYLCHCYDFQSFVFTDGVMYKILQAYFSVNDNAIGVVVNFPLHYGIMK